MKVSKEPAVVALKNGRIRMLEVGYMENGMNK